jgi:hypothetical protein
MIHALLLSLLILTQPYDQATQDALARIGQWDGKTLTAQLQGPYEDPIQQEIPFGRSSYYLTPWRAYMDTQQASQYLNVLGVNFTANEREADATAQLLEEAGFWGGRIEIGWGSLDYDNPVHIRGAQRLQTKIQAMQKHNQRPLVLLNANSGMPCPTLQFKTQLLDDAKAGDRRVHLKAHDGIKVGYTGLKGLNPRRIGWPIIMSIDDQGWCELSAPLPVDLKADTVALATRKYMPFAGAVFEDGTPNEHAYETVEGWKQYVKIICQFMKETLQTEGKPDAGFDIEVWNEYTFGSDFLKDRYYHDPERKFKEPIRYANHGREMTGHELILPLTVDYVNDPANTLPGVGVISGFSNQRPWDNGSEMWPGQAGFSRHYYSSLDAWRPSNGKSGTLSPSILKDWHSGPVNALGIADGTPDKKDWHTVIPGSFFIPTLRLAMPEAQHYGYKTEFMSRDIQPFPGPWSHHHRFSNPGTGQNAEVWMTETNVHRNPYLEHVAQQAKVSMDDPRVSRFAHDMATRTMIRSYLFYSHKGVKHVDMYAVKQNDLHFSVIPDAFFEALKKADYQLTDDVRALAGPQLAAIKNISDVFKQGKPIDVPRALKVEKLVEHKPRLVFAGDGTPAHPDRYNRDDFAVLPFAMDQNKYVVAYYVVTRNMMHTWQAQYDPLDIRRYSMPPQQFDLTLSNVRGTNVKVSAYDPIVNRSVPVKVLGSDSNTLTLQLDTVDYPRLLLIEEDKPGPVIQSPKLTHQPDGKAILRFTTRTPVKPLVTWGVLPDRNSDGKKVLPAGTDHEMIIDVAGVLDWNIATRKRPTDQASPLSNFHLPILSSVDAPSSFKTNLPDGLHWQKDADVYAMTLTGSQGKVTVTCQALDTQPSRIAQLLPELSMTDRINQRYSDWGNRKAICVVVNFDIPAHPGLDADSQQWFFTPMNQGTVVLHFAGNDKAMRQQSRTIDAITNAFVFE